MSFVASARKRSRISAIFTSVTSSTTLTASTVAPCSSFTGVALAIVQRSSPVSRMR